MSMSLEGTHTLFRLGRYAEIVDRLGHVPSVTLTPEHRILVAHSLFHVGDTKKASALIANENRDGASGRLRSYCELLTGLIERRNGCLESALNHFKLALQLARDAKDERQAAWAALHGFRTLAETRPSEALLAMLRDVRNQVTEVADPHLTTYMHDSIALMEASMGRPEEARRHLRICLSLLEQHPNAWLEQVVNVNKFFVDFLECKYEDSLKCLKAARSLFNIAGERQRAVIECNEGHALLALGRFSAAVQRFANIVEHHKGLPLLAALDGLARAHLSTDDLDACTSALEQLTILSSKDSTVKAAFAGRWTSITRNKLLLRRGLAREAVSSISTDLSTFEIVEDRLLVVFLKCLKMEALARSGATNEASKLIASLAATLTHMTADQQAAYYRAVAVTLQSSRLPLTAAIFSRADAIWQATGNRCSSAELRHLRTSHGPVRSVLSKSEESLLAITGLAALFGFAGNAALVGAELKKIVEALGGDHQARIDEVDGEISVLERDEQSATLEIGQRGARKIVFSASVPSDPLKALLLADVFRVARAALTLERFRQEERNRAALWPADPVETEAGALFLSEEMQTLVATARRVAAANIPVLITGETGTGKEVLARLIHAYSPRAKATFMPFNCTATPKDMLDSQLFGHRRGSFTGATDHFQGVIRAAGGGTLFLDEIGETTLDVQPKLLRFLESSEVHPIGETHPARVDVRVIAATNADLESLVAMGRFREDLLYRLNTVQLPIPPLRERRVEIPALAAHYLRKYAQENHKGDLRLAEETIEYLVLYRWPGNIRQLANEMRRMAALAEKSAVLMPEHLSPELAASRRTIPPSERVLDDTELAVRLNQPLPAIVGHAERAAIQYALKKCGGRLEETAAMLGISRKGLYLKRMRYGLEEPAGSQPAAAFEVA